MLLQKFGNRLKNIREQNGLSQAKLSELTGVIREQISRIENGQINPTLETIYRLSNALQVPLKEIVDFDIDNELVFKERKLKPFVKWAGGKTQILDKLNEFLPKKFNTFFEPFLGGGAFLFNLQPNRAVVSDFNEELMITYRCFQDNESFNLMIKEIIKHENNHNEEYYYLVREMDRKDNYHALPNFEKAARLIYLNKACFNGLYRVNSKGYFNVPSGKKAVVKAYNKELFDNLHDYFSSCSINLLDGDFESSIAGAKKGDFVYFDPPYDTLEDKDSFTTYTKHAFGKEEQKRLADVFKRLSEDGVFVMLSNHNTTYINELYKEFKINVIEARRNINSKGEGRGKIEEVIITNY